MSGPDDEIGRLRVQHSAKTGHTVVQIVGIRIGIRKSSALINGVHQMRAVASRRAGPFGTQRNRDHRRTIVAVQTPGICARKRAFRDGRRIPVRFLRSRHASATKSQCAKDDNGF